MAWIGTAPLLLGAALAALSQDSPRANSFVKADAGKLPAGWKADKTGTGTGSVWQVRADATAPSKSGFVLAQIAESPRPMFNLCVAETPVLQDVEISVAFKAVKGKVDQGGGVVWRYQDPANYYIARYNPLEFNYRVYKVVAGKRIQLDTKEEMKPVAGTWHTLKVRQSGARIECFLDGVKHLEASDSTLAKPGKVGLWTKADAETHFDSFQVRDLAK